MAEQETVVLTDEQQAGADALWRTANYVQDAARDLTGMSDGRKRAFADVEPVLRSLSESVVDDEAATWPGVPVTDLARMVVVNVLTEEARGTQRLRRQWRAGRLLTHLAAQSERPYVRERIGLDA